MLITINGEKAEFPGGTNIYDIAKITDFKRVLGAKVNGEVVSADTSLTEDSEVTLLNFADDEGKKIYRHTCAHVLAQAVKKIFPTVKLAIGPAIDSGFYYDFDFTTPISSEDLEAIEKEMKSIIKANLPIKRFTLSRDKALELMKSFNESYKIELINELPPGEEIYFYEQGTFVDLCRGPHLHSTGAIKAFKLTSLTGAYWKGSEKNKMLSRIYGTAFDKKSDLTEHLEKMEEAKKRDHNRLGRELGLFMTDESIGQGLPLLMPKGAKIIQTLQRFVEDEESRRGYLLTKTPLMAKSDLYKISGHWDHYKSGMFVIGDEEKDAEVLALRPMTCPFQYTIYNNGLKSYRDLPCRYGETSTLFRNEASGEMHGLIRVRQFTISEGHIVCTPSQLKKEFEECTKLADFLLSAIGLREDVTFRFSKWDPKNRDKFIDDEKQWEIAENTMKDILDSLGIDYTVGIGEAAFYGPKLDIQTKNVWGKEDTIVTIQVDMFLAEKFDMSYVDENGDKKRPYIIHRTSMGCYERTLALLIEKYAGAFPVWLAPTQVNVISLTDRNAEKAREIAAILTRENIRTVCDCRNETVGYKIRAAQLEKVPYMLIIGDKEVEEGVVAVRGRVEGDMGKCNLETFISKIRKSIDEKVIKNA